MTQFFDDSKKYLEFVDKNKQEISDNLKPIFTIGEYFFKAGAQSRQAEVDELQKRIKKAEKLMRLFFEEDSYEYAISAHEILKGEQNEK